MIWILCLAIWKTFTLMLHAKKRFGSKVESNDRSEKTLNYCVNETRRGIDNQGGIERGEDHGKVCIMVRSLYSPKCQSGISLALF
jgi:hypothetical protein